jgi:cation transport regulator
MATIARGAADARSNGEETTMPYKNRSELPESVRQNLPAHAQGIYKEAFNSAWDQYGHDESRAHRVAWGAVEQSYHKDPFGKWAEGATKEHAHR